MNRNDFMKLFSLTEWDSALECADSMNAEGIDWDKIAQLFINTADFLALL